ncbi:efflux RND transporter permease subunit [Denitromonas ohlonensis]|uniref:MMPL family transporter n=2 Tax=Denitromonas TaxID=139331 RepID=A0A558CIR6_9RHOO|nr:MMPL family transporter [Denitromonas ohlonensis]TVO63518.1 MMPL family transporter [Denitromonas ohlonensis]TVO75395.1 MMPL family transporter [Denitromonas ohlonensis]TVT48653.1 MAG: MMPL family transporter [Denitromonas halophila]TVT75724.1 MAG: MMPL family transporter [Denitromonas halophila]
MAIPTDKQAAMAVISDPRDFDPSSGSLIERIVFNHRRLLVLVCVLITAGLVSQALFLRINASFEKMMPVSHPFIQNYLKSASDLKGLGNSVRIVVENANGDIYDANYLAALRDINDRVFLIPGVDRSFMKSLWMPVVRWTEITAEGYKGGAVMPDAYDGSPESISALRSNIHRAGIVGSLVGNDERSSMLFVPLLSRDAVSGKALDYGAFRDALDQIRIEYGDKGVNIYIIGFAQLVGDLIHGLIEVFTYFMYAALICSALILVYTRCLRSTALVVSCSLVAVAWQLGLMHVMGLVLDPYSVLVPFLIFAIGVSHGAQKMNGIMQDIGRGTHRYVAARYTFRRLFLAGLTALLADAVGFAVLYVIDIPIIRDLAIAASTGVAVLIFTNLILLPVLLSYTGVSEAAASRSLRAEREDHPLSRLLSRFTRRSWALGIIAFSVAATVAAVIVASDLKIGDLDPGAPELRPDSTYNRDNAYITANYKLSSDQFAVIVTTPEYGLVNYETLMEMDRLEEILRDLPGVQTTTSAASLARSYTTASFEGSPKWYTLNRDKYVISDALNYVFDANPEMFNDSRSVAPIIAFLADHKADTLDRVVATVEAFAAKHNTGDRHFLLAAGNSGIEAATNIAVKDANRSMLFYVYAAVVVLCFITFRSWRAVVVAVVPLMVTSLLCEALMVVMGIGVKVATLPVTALGVGIGVDYSLYLLAVQLAAQRDGLSLTDAYCKALVFTGKVVALIGITLSAAVIPWIWSPIKFQADMGLLLAFMFLWNMLGALIVIPSLAAFLMNPRGGGSAEATRVEHARVASGGTPPMQEGSAPPASVCAAEAR